MFLGLWDPGVRVLFESSVGLSCYIYIYICCYIYIYEFPIQLTENAPPPPVPGSGFRVSGLRVSDFKLVFKAWG